MKKAKVYAALNVQVLISAGTYLVAKLAILAFGALPLLALRFLLASALFAVLLQLVPGPKLPALRGRPGELLALLCGPLNQLLFLVGLSASTPTHAALLYALTPVAVYLLARVRRHERPSGLKVLGIALAFAGVALVLLAGYCRVADPTRQATIHGDLLILLAVVAWSMYSVEGKKIAERDGALQVAAWSSMLGALCSLPFLPWLLVPAKLAAAPAVPWLEVAYLAFLTSVLSYFLWSYALRRLDASKVAIFANLQPVATAVLARTLYGEPFNARLLVGGGLVLTGVFFTEWG